ncbi:MAG: hypothetical protein WBF47_24020 [Xanthobacteraceae bacterium]
MTESTATAGEVDAIYVVVERRVQGENLKYIERVVERTFPNGVVDAGCVDCGIQYVGAPEAYAQPSTNGPSGTGPEGTSKGTISGSGTNPPGSNMAAPGSGKSATKHSKKKQSS